MPKYNFRADMMVITDILDYDSLHEEIIDAINAVIMEKHQSWIGGSISLKPYEEKN